MPAMNSQLLMIEDDHRLAQMVGEYLGQSGLQVTHMADGASGLARLQGSEPPDLVILDLMLPDMDGLEVCRRLRALPGPAAQVLAHHLRQAVVVFDHQQLRVHGRHLRLPVSRGVEAWVKFGKPVFTMFSIAVCV